MGWKIWKSADERAKEEFSKAESLRNQGKYGEAASSYSTAARLFTESKKESEAKISSVLASLYSAVAQPTPENLLNCSNWAASLSSDFELRVPQTIAAGDLATETKLLSRYVKLIPFFDQIDQADESVAAEFENLAAEMFSLGRSEFLLNRLFSIASESPHAQGYKLSGLSSMIRGNLIVKFEPSKAVEFLSQAIEHFKSAGITTYAEKTADETRMMSEVAKCWFCGRSVQGQRYHFEYLDAYVTPYMESKYGQETPPVSQKAKIAACVACSSAIRRIADIIAKAYYEEAIRQLMSVRQELLQMIARLADRVDELARVAHTHHG